MGVSKRVKWTFLGVNKGWRWVKTFVAHQDRTGTQACTFNFEIDAREAATHASFHPAAYTSTKVTWTPTYTT